MNDPLHIEYEDLKEHDRVLIHNAVREIDKKYSERVGCTEACNKEVNFIFDWLLPVKFFGVKISLTIVVLCMFSGVGGFYALIKLLE